MTTTIPLTENIILPGIGPVTPESGMLLLECCSDGRHYPGKNGVYNVLATGDLKVEFILFEDHAIAYINSAMGYPAYYPVPEICLDTPVKAVLMDLDGTTVHSEHFWIWIIEKTTASLLNNPAFELEDSDVPFVSGHSVSEHLKYCCSKYCPDKSVEEARKWYFKHTNFEMNEIMEGRGKKNAFTPSPGIKDFLYSLKDLNVKIGLVTSGLYEKAWPEILDAFKTLGMGDPKEFYDAIITAGHAIRHGEPGTLGELSPKPHPWLYAETARVGLGIPAEERHQVVGIEDSGAGIVSIALAGFAPIGIAGGNIIECGTVPLCHSFANTFEDILQIL
ncbi:MAG: HAD family phosphatase [Kiritimatiellales bacterium]|nr:HAD family phosphatase [Kiritimatiellales bacterium]